MVRLYQDRCEDALRLFGAARELAAEVGDPRPLALLAHRTGLALRGLRRYGAAERQLRAALEAVRALPDRYHEADVLTGMGELYLATGRPAYAAAALDKALELLRDGSGPALLAEAARLRARCEKGPDNG